jgi:hypothetical protein
VTLLAVRDGGFDEKALLRVVADRPAFGCFNNALYVESFAVPARTTSEVIPAMGFGF